MLQARENSTIGVTSHTIEMPRPRAGLFVLYWPDFTSKSRYDKRMNPHPAPPVHGDTEAERFDNAVRKTFTVSKEEM